MTDPEFLTAEEQALSERFVAQGYLIAPVENRAALDRIRAHVAAAAAEALGIAAMQTDGSSGEGPSGDGIGALLDGIHGHVDSERLNALRLSVIGAMAAAPWFRAAYFSLARQALSTVIGNELAMISAAAGGNAVTSAAPAGRIASRRMPRPEPGTARRP